MNKVSRYWTQRKVSALPDGKCTKRRRTWIATPSWTYATRQLHGRMVPADRAMTLRIVGGIGWCRVKSPSLTSKSTLADGAFLLVKTGDMMIGQG